MAQLFARAFNIEGQAVAKLMELYESELRQETYTPTAVAKLRAQIREGQAKEREKEALAARVAAM